MIYLIDVNLPKSFALIKTMSCLFVKDYSDEMPDNDIWQMAVKYEYTILTRDKDFYHRAMQYKIIPKIILFRLGNCRSNELFEYFQRNLSTVEKHLVKHNLLVLWPAEIQVVI